MLCVVSQVYEVTRNLQNDDKAKLRQYCDNVIRKKIARVAREKKGLKFKFNTNIDVQSIQKVSSIHFKNPSHDHSFLLHLFRLT